MIAPRFAPLASMCVLIAMGCATRSPVPVQPAKPLPTPDASALSRAVTDYDQPPRQVYVTRPKYPPAAFKQRLEGVVDLDILIDETGRVATWKVTKSVPGLDEAAIRCVTEWRFVPAQRRGEPVASVARAPVTFRIYGGPERKTRR